MATAKKFAIFGAGEARQHCLAALGREQVSCFVDNFPKGPVYCDIEVIGFERLKEVYPAVTLIVATYDYADEICRQLGRSGMTQYMVFTREMFERLPQYQRFDIRIGYPASEIFADYRLMDYRQIAVYSHAETLDLWLFLLSSHNLIDRVKYIVADIAVPNKYGITCDDLENIEVDIDCLIVAVQRQDNRLCAYLEAEDGRKPYAVADFFNVDQFVEGTYCSEITPYKNKYKGKRCFLVGNGPSLRAEDLDTLHRNNEMTFGCNRVHLIFDRTEWRPDFYCVSDHIYTEDVCKIMTGDYGDKVIVCDWIAPEDSPVHAGDAIVLHGVLEDFPPNLPRISDDAARRVYWGCTVIVMYDIMLQAAFYMGFEEIYLIGVDNSGSGHFPNNYLNEAEAARFAPSLYLEAHGKSNLAYQKARLYSEAIGVKVFNATRGGELEVFERVDFDSLFPG